jgi:hypothetical protein
MSLITKISPINKRDDIGSLSNKDLNLHDCLTDNADWNDEYWDFYQDCVIPFISVLKRTYEASTKGIEFQAIWAGDKPELTIELPIEQLLNAIITNKVSTRAKYVVNKNA